MEELIHDNDSNNSYNSYDRIMTFSDMPKSVNSEALARAY